MAGVDIATRSFEREAEEVEKYLRENRDKTCGECSNWSPCPCNCGWGHCPEDGGFYVYKDETGVKDWECMNFDGRIQNG